MIGEGKMEKVGKAPPTHSCVRVWVCLGTWLRFYAQQILCGRLINIFAQVN